MGCGSSAANLGHLWRDGDGGGKELAFIILDVGWYTTAETNPPNARSLMYLKGGKLEGMLHVPCCDPAIFNT